MDETKKQTIEKYVEKYRENYKNDEVLDFYDFFEVNRDIELSELKKFIKNEKIRILFHPDLEHYLSEQNRKDFLDLGNKLISIIDNDFSDSAKRAAYDTKLKMDNRRNQNHHEFQNRNRNQQSNGGFYHEFDKEKMDEATKTNILKYGFCATDVAFKKYIFSGDSSGFTRDYWARRKIEDLGVSEILSVLESYVPNQTKVNYEKMMIYYFTDLVNQDQQKNGEIYQKFSCYLKACTETISKYSQIPGYEDQALCAIQKFISNGEVGAFTRNNNARYLLRENVDPRDGKFLTYIYLSNFRKYYPEYEWDNLSRMSDRELVLEFELLLKRQMNLENTARNRRGR